MSTIESIDGLPVLNAKKPIKLHVNKNDVRISDPKKPDHCAVAVACKRELAAKEVRVHLSRVYVRTNNSNWTRYIVPKSMRTEIIAFDRGGTFVPGDFSLSAPQPSKATGKKQGSPNKSTAGKKRTKAKPRPYAVVKDVRGGPAVQS